MISESVYVVDDAQSARDVISLALKKNYHVKAFPSAESAIEAMGNAPPDLVLLDIGLPGMSGIEALEQIKRLYVIRKNQGDSGLEIGFFHQSKQTIRNGHFWSTLPRLVFARHQIKYCWGQEARNVSANDFEEVVLKAVADEGMNLFLLDGTKWNVNPGDIPTVLTWVPGAKVRITIANKKSFYPYKLYHTGTGSSVKARKD